MPKLLSLIFAAFAGLGMAQGALAQAWPSAPITIVVPFPAGAGPDAVARLLAEKLSISLKQPVRIDNRPGASGTLGASAVARSRADGHTLLFTPSTFAIAPHVLAEGAAAADVVKDFSPVILAVSTPIVLVARADLGVRDAKALSKLARDGTELMYGTPGNGSPMHIAGELFNRSAEIKSVHVPYRGVAPAVNDLLGGHLKLMYVSLSSIMPHIAGGRVVLLATVERRRTPLLPALPTMAEQGFKGVEVDAWYGLLGPKGMPEEAVQVLNRHLNAALALPDVAERLKAMGAVPVGGKPADLAKEVADDFARYGRIVREFGIQAD